MQGLKSTLLEKVVMPFRQFRGNEKKPGTPTTFENFLTNRPDGGDSIVINGVHMKRTEDLLVHAGIDPMLTTMNEILTREDDFKWLVGPWISDIVWRGYVGEPAKPALWTKLCYAIGVPVVQETLKRVKLWFSGRPAPTGELATIPTAKLFHGDESIAWKKVAWGLEMSNEFLRFSPVPIIEPYLVEAGRIQQVTKDLACVAAIVNGSLSTGADSCPIIGVAATETGLAYVDFVEPWALGDQIGQNWNTLLYPRSMAVTVGSINEFKPYLDLGVALAPLRQTPEPVPDRFVSASVPDHQTIMVDTRNCVRERVSIPFHVMNDDDIRTYSQIITFVESSVFEKTGEKSCLGIDETQARGEAGASYGIPTWFELGQHRP